MDITFNQEQLIVEQLGKFFKLDAELPVHIYVKSYVKKITLDIDIEDLETEYKRIMFEIDEMEGSVAKGKFSYALYNDDDAAFGRTINLPEYLKTEHFDMDFQHTYLIELVAPFFLQHMEYSFAFDDIELNQGMYEKIWEIVHYRDGGSISKYGTRISYSDVREEFCGKVPPMPASFNRLPALKKDAEMAIEKLAKYCVTKYFNQNIFAMDYFSDTRMNILLEFNEESYNNVKANLGLTENFTSEHRGLQEEEINRLLFKAVGLEDVYVEAKQLYADLIKASGNAAFIGNYMRMHNQYSGEYQLPLEMLQMVTIDKKRYEPFYDMITTAGMFMGYDIYKQILSPYFKNVFSVEDEVDDTIFDIVSKVEVDREAFKRAIEIARQKDYCPEWLAEIYESETYPKVRVPYNPKIKAFQFSDLKPDDIRANLFGALLFEKWKGSDYLPLIYAYERLTQG